MTHRNRNPPHQMVALKINMLSIKVTPFSWQPVCNASRLFVLTKPSAISMLASHPVSTDSLPGGSSLILK
jgi:hypothetical protein